MEEVDAFLCKRIDTFLESPIVRLPCSSHEGSAYRNRRTAKKIKTEPIPTACYRCQAKFTDQQDTESCHLWRGLDFHGPMFTSTLDHRGLDDYPHPAWCNFPALCALCRHFYADYAEKAYAKAAPAQPEIIEAVKQAGTPLVPELQVLVARYAFEQPEKYEKCPQCLLPPPTEEQKAAVQKAYRRQQVRNRRNPFLNTTTKKRKKRSSRN